MIMRQKPEESVTWCRHVLEPCVQGGAHRRANLSSPAQTVRQRMHNQKNGLPTASKLQTSTISGRQILIRRRRKHRNMKRLDPALHHRSSALENTLRIDQASFAHRRPNRATHLGQVMGTSGFSRGWNGALRSSIRDKRGRADGRKSVLQVFVFPYVNYCTPYPCCCAQNGTCPVRLRAARHARNPFARQAGPPSRAKL